MVLFGTWSFHTKEWEMAKPIPVRIVSIDVLTQSPKPTSQEEFNKFKEVTTQEAAKPAPTLEKKIKRETRPKAEPKPAALVQKSVKASLP